MTYRPKFFKDIVGQDEVKDALSVAITSAKSRNDVLGHVLIDAAAGLGKTTLSMAIAHELGVKFKTILGGNIRSFTKDILPTIVNMEYGQVLFIDEIHRINKRVAESLYTILEDFRVDTPIPKDDGETEIVTFELPKFTIVGATTEMGKLVKPFIDRFKLRFELQPYTKDQILFLLKSNAQKLGLSIEPHALERLAGASRGTPRIANSLLEWVRDYSIAKQLQVVSGSDLEASLKMRGIGLDGSTSNDRKYLDFLKKQNGKPVGISTISLSIGIDQDTIENVIEPFLLSQNKIIKSNKGRIAS